MTHFATVFTRNVALNFLTIDHRSRQFVVVTGPLDPPLYRTQDPAYFIVGQQLLFLPRTLHGMGPSCTC
jgi:hypothetical protein